MLAPMTHHQRLFQSVIQGRTARGDSARLGWYWNHYVSCLVYQRRPWVNQSKLLL